MNTVIISYKDFLNDPLVIFNYDHTQIKYGYSYNKVNNLIQLGYFKDKKYDKFIIEATNDDIKVFNSSC